jgi:hypothetical protein
MVPLPLRCHDLALHAFLNHPMRVTLPAHLISLDSISLIMIDEEHKLRNALLYYFFQNFPILSFINSNILNIPSDSLN